MLFVTNGLTSNYFVISSVTVLYTTIYIIDMMMQGGFVSCSYNGVRA